MTAEIELSARAMDGLRDLVARESLAGRQTTIDELGESIIVRTLDAAERGEWLLKPKTPSMSSEPQAWSKSRYTPKVDGAPRSACGNCRQPGHNRMTCKDGTQGLGKRALSIEPPPFVADSSLDPIVEAAELRERIDALEAETKQYEEIRSELDARILRNRVAMELAKQQLAANRKDRR